MGDSLIEMGFGSAGLADWIMWAALGIIEAIVAQIVLGGRRMLALDITVGMVAAVIGGFLSTCWLDQAPMQMLIISLLSALFFGAAALWIAGVIFIHFSKK